MHCLLQGPSVSPVGARVRFPAPNSGSVLRFRAPPPRGSGEHAKRRVALGPGSAPPPGAGRRAERRRPGRLGRNEKCAAVEAATPESGRGRGDLGGFERRWRDTRATAGTTFRRRSRVFLVGELSKFPLPYNSWREASGSLPSPGVRPPAAGGGTPRASWFTRGKRARKCLPSELWGG